MEEHTDPRVRPYAAAGVLFFDADERVMLVRTTYKPDHDVPGGFIQPGELPSEAAAREVWEELGIRPPIGPLLVVDWAPQDADDKVLFVFDGGVLTDPFLDAVQLDGVELAGYEFCERERVGDLTLPRMARRLEAAFLARVTGRTVYLEHGVARG